MAALERPSYFFTNLCSLHWRETLITAHTDLVELASEADLLNLVDTDEHEQRLTHTRGVIEAHRRQAARLREGLSLKPRLVQ